MREMNRMTITKDEPTMADLVKKYCKPRRYGFRDIKRVLKDQKEKPPRKR